MIKLPALFFFVITLLSCQSEPTSKQTTLPSDAPPPVGISRPGGSGGIADEIRSHTETGSPSSLLRSLEIISGNNLASTEFGRIMVHVNASLLETLYPAITARLLARDPPLTHSYSRILREAEKGVYTAPARNSSDFLEHVLPFLAYFPPYSARTPSSDSYRSALPHLEKAAALNSESALTGYFSGVVHENTGRPDDALSRYSLVWDSYPDCYPAALGIARIMDAQGRKDEAAQFLYNLALRAPDNTQIKRQLAIANYNLGAWSMAEALASEILHENSRDGEFVLMMAHILVEQGSLHQAQTFLDTYANVNPSNKLYLFLRSRIQNEVYRNREAALGNLRSVLRNAPLTDAVEINAAIYAAGLLTESSRPNEQAEGRDLLRRLLSVPNPHIEAVSLALSDAIRREDWAEAGTYLGRLLGERRSSGDLISAYTVERAQGNNAAALSYAQELYRRDPSDEEGEAAYISALIAAGRREEAARMTRSKLAGLSGGAMKSRYHYLLSQTRTSEELMLGDLQSSLFENPRNLDALIASFEIYHRRKDERRAVYYLRQALAAAPSDPRLIRYKAEYPQFF